VLVTFRGATDEEASEPHRAVGSRTDALVEAMVGPEAWIGGDRLGERPVPRELDHTLRHALDGGLALLKLSPLAFAATPCSPLAAEPAPLGDPIALVRALKRRQERGWEPGGGEMERPRRDLTREEAIAAIRGWHPGAAVLFCNGYMARAAQACGDRASDFFNVGYMGGTLAMGWALARARPDLEVVVVDGDQNAQMSAMKDHLLLEYPANLHWYILDNGLGESVGGVPSLPLSPLYRALARVLPIRPDGRPFAHPRVSHAGPGAIADPRSSNSSNSSNGLPALAQRFRRWIAERPPGPGGDQGS
jgi:hypothetical protein